MIAEGLVDFELVGGSIRSQPVRCRSQLPSATGVRQYRAVTLALYVTKDRICGRRRGRNCSFGGLRRRCDAPADGRQPQILTQLLPFQWAGVPLVTVATAPQQDRLFRQKCMRCDRHCQREQRFDAAFGACNRHHHLWLTHRYFQYKTERDIVCTPWARCISAYWPRRRKKLRTTIHDRKWSKADSRTAGRPRSHSCITPKSRRCWSKNSSGQILPDLFTLDIAGAPRWSVCRAPSRIRRRKSLSSLSAYNPLRECSLNIGSAWVEAGSLLNGGGTWETVKDRQMKISVVRGPGRRVGISDPANPSINLFILPQRIPPILTNLPQRQ